MTRSRPQMARPLLSDDFSRILEQTSGLWNDLRGARLFITGGTGFFGCWLLESFLWANREFGLGARLTILTRDEKSFRMKRPHLADHPEISFHAGDVRSFAFPSGRFTHFIHAASETAVDLNQDNPLLMLDTLALGARRVFDFAQSYGVERFLLISSGAVYGPQPADMTHIPEEYAGAPDIMDARSAYAEGKRFAELLGLIHVHKRPRLEVKIARCFAFAGPYMSFDGHFAIGNFIKDAVEGRPISVSGDGSARRSYLYAADLAIWLWTILLRGQSLRPYNVGSEDFVTMADLARIVQSAANPAVPIHVQKEPKPGLGAKRYVPSTKRAREELGLRQTMELTGLVRRTAGWLAKSKNKVPASSGY